MTEPTSPLDGANVRTLTARLCEVEAVLAVVGSLGAKLREELLGRAIGRWREDGTAPTFRADGLGSVSLSVPKQQAVVDDQHAFASWVAERHPEAATARAVITCPPDKLEALLEALHAAIDEMPAVTLTADVEVSGPFAKRLLEQESVIADAGDRGRVAIDEATGAIIDGVVIKPGADPAVPDGPQPRSISVRLDAQAKADAAAQAHARLATVLERGLSDALAADVRELPVAAGNSEPAMPDVADVRALAADGEPDDEPSTDCARDGCGHPKARHNGKTNTGKCRVLVPADVRGAADAADVARLEQDAAEPCKCSRYVAPAPVAVAW